MAYTCKFGRRKAAVAKCKIYPNETHSVLVNGKESKVYFTDYFSRKLTDAIKEYNLENYRIEFFVKGGGLTGQAESCRLALTKAIVEINPDLRQVARNNDWITTDPRKVLSKRPGLKKARKAPQWVKR